LDSTLFDCLFKTDNVNLRSCSFSYFKEITQKSFELCSNYCPVECDSISYGLSFKSIYDYPYTGPIQGATDQSLSTQFTSYDDIKKTFFSITIFYPDLCYMLIGQEAKILLIDLIPGIGGTLGLFLGTSFMSFIEIIEVFSVILFYIIPSTLSSNKVNRQN